MKVAFNKYLLGQTLNGLGRNPNPVLTLRHHGESSVERSRRPRESMAITSHSATCSTRSTNGECGPLDNLAFGTAVPGDLYDKDLITGFNHRQTNWEFSAGVQHELVPRVALDVGYFRRSWAHFQVTDNRCSARGLHRVQHRRANRPAPAGRWRLHADRLL